MNIGGRPIEITVLMPCLNEANTLPVCIRKAMASLDEMGAAGEVLISDNGSTDGSREIAVSAGARVLEVAERGYGNALRSGIAAANGKFIIMADSDDSYELDRMGPFVEKLRDGYELVMGNRFRGGIRPGAMPFLHRYLGNPVLTAIGKIFFGCPSGDFHCGMRGFSRESALRMDLQSPGMEFASEMVIKATLLGMRITEVPTVLSPDGRGRKPHLRTWRDGWRHLRFMLLFSPNWLFVYPGAMFMLMGLILGVPLTRGPLQIGKVTFDVHTLLFSSASVVIGFQAVLFGVFARVFAVTQRLLPVSSLFARVAGLRTFEWGLFFGGAFFLCGLAGSVYSLRYWAISHFGDLDPRMTLRFVIPSVTAMILGLQTGLAGFFLSVLGLQNRLSPRREDA
ncbi:MAG: glycosyltransferase [Deltaproteobacteria bacterium]|nr:glycosyltransferase [Deltaproteobacteria bacterium]